MGLLLNILTSEAFRKRPAMFVGTRNFRDIASWLRGVEFCLSQSVPEQPLELDGLREWLHMNLDGPGNTDWLGIIQVEFGDEEETTEKIFEYVDKFLQDLSEKGLDKIITDHAEYEKKRYDGIVTSRLGGTHYRKPGKIF